MAARAQPPWTGGSMGSYTESTIQGFDCGATRTSAGRSPSSAHDGFEPAVPRHDWASALARLGMDAGRPPDHPPPVLTGRRFLSTATAALALALLVGCSGPGRRGLGRRG